MDACSLCCDESRAWAVGPCDHATCLVCSVRLRVLCEQRDCPVCREKLNKVVVSDSIKPFSLPPHGCKVDRKHGYFFCTTQLHERYKSLQAYRCSKCRDKPVFGTFGLLRDHARKTHGLVYCDICCENLKLFPFELRQYSRQELTRHRREGDPEDPSYKGHPLCQFCEERFFDNDELHRHLRKAHFWCHFCESDGKQDYYSTYPLLRNHFREEHFLCVEGPCQQEKFTSVFRTKIDLQVHRSKIHSRGVTKAEAKQMRQLDVGFSYGRSADDRDGGGVVNYSASGGGRGQWQHVPQRGRHSKTRDRDCEDRTAAGGGQSALAQQQRESKSPPSLAGWRKQKTSGSTATPGAGGGQYMSEQPPRLKQRQQRQTAQPQPTTNSKEETVGNTLATSSDTKSVSVTPTTTTEAAAAQAKKPPGFEVSRPMNSDSTSEWPDLLSLSIASEQPRQAAPKIQPLDVGYNPQPPSHFPPLGISLLSTNNNFPTAPVERSRASLSAAVASSIPPGFVNPQWQLIQQDSIYKSSSSSNLPLCRATTGNMGSAILQQGVTEGSVINLVREALNNDRERYNYFRNLSGWYRNSEITVQEYVLRCRELFGDLQWRTIGPKLAQVMPIEGKRNELLQNVYAGMNHLQYPVPSPPDYFTQLQGPPHQPMPGNASTTVGPAPFHVSRSDPGLLQMGASAKWGVLSNRVVPSWESELEYPNLHPGLSSVASGGVRRQPQPPGLSAHSWKARVPV